MVWSSPRLLKSLVETDRDREMVSRMSEMKVKKSETLKKRKKRRPKILGFISKLLSVP